MKKNLILLTLMIFSLSLVRANGVNNNIQEPRGIDLGEYAFGIPVEQLGFDDNSTFSISFWMYAKEYNHSALGTNFVNIRDVYEFWPLSDYGYMWANIGSYEEGFGNKINFYLRQRYSTIPFMKTNDMNPSEVNTGEWKYFTFVFDLEEYRKLTIYINGVSSYEIEMLVDTYYWLQDFIVMIGGKAYQRAPLNAYIDKVQFYNKALTSGEVIESMTAPLLNDGSLLGYWDFEYGCTTDSEGFMQADNGVIKATMYKILTNSYEESSGLEIQPFSFGDGVDPESVIQGVEKYVEKEPKTKAFVSNGVLYIESTDDITSVNIYDTMGRGILTAKPSLVEREVAITLPNVKGVLIVKVNNEVIKIIN